MEDVLWINASFSIYIYWKTLTLASKLVKSQESYICQCTVCFVFEAEIDHENTGKYDLLIKWKIDEINKVGSFKYFWSKIWLRNIIITARNYQSVSLAHTFIGCNILSWLEGAAPRSWKRSGKITPKLVRLNFQLLGLTGPPSRARGGP